MSNPRSESITINEKSGSKVSLVKTNKDEEENISGPNDTIQFNPPAYVQRYQAVENVLLDEKYQGKLKKIVDFGCGECNFYKYIKHMKGIEEVLFVDLSTEDVNMGIRRSRPFATDYLVKRRKSLEYKFLIGCITHNDPMLIGTDALVCIEVIEHLYEDTIIKLVYNTFSFIKPKVAVFTTPNSEFNVMFTSMRYSNNMRHPDHKFEWTRQQFQDWANNVVLRYPDYEVTFQSIADGPPGTEHLGGCSQMAIFCKVADSESQTPEPPGESKYIVVHTNLIFVQPDERSEERKILDDAAYTIYRLSTWKDLEDADDLKIYLKEVIENMKDYTPSEELLTKLLNEDSWSVCTDDCNNPYVIYQNEAPESDSDLYDEEENGNVMDNCKELLGCKNPSIGSNWDTDSN